MLGQKDLYTPGIHGVPYLFESDIGFMPVTWLPFLVGEEMRRRLGMVLAELECETAHTYPAGDHTIFVGRVEAADCRGDAGLEPLLYYRRIHT